VSAMSQDLDLLRHEILDYLRSRDFVVFHCLSRAGDSTPTVRWDSEHYPDFREFLEVAQAAGVRMIHFTRRELFEVQLEELLERLGSAGLPDADRQEAERRLQPLRQQVGSTGTLELAFDLQGHLYLFVVRSPWYEEFMDVAELVEESLEEYDEEEPEPGRLGGYYSQN